MKNISEEKVMETAIAVVYLDPECQDCPGVHCAVQGPLLQLVVLKRDEFLDAVIAAVKASFRGAWEKEDKERN